jgi:glycosyltransferase involved in cell wall biosynthesis
MNKLTATVLIATKNRRDDLRRAISSCLEQTIAPEILVLDDGSTDDTYEMIRREFPTVHIHREEKSQGYIVQRNRGSHLASGDIIFSIDDDAEIPSPRTIAQTLNEFTDPSIGAVAIPFVNVNCSAATLQRSPDAEIIYVTDSFVGTAYAIRRDLFLKLGGYREFLFHQGEEEDLCVRMLDAGYVTRLGSGDSICHYQSPIRSRSRMDVYGGRNKILFCWYNVPMPDFLIHLPGACLNRIAFGLTSRDPLRAIQGVARGLAACLWQWRKRRPVRRETYKLFRHIRKCGAVPLSAVTKLRR